MGGSKQQLTTVHHLKRSSVHEISQISENNVKDMKNHEASTATQKNVQRPKRTHRRSYSDISQVFKSPTKVILTNIFHFCLRLYCSRSQMTSRHGKIKKSRYKNSQKGFIIV